MVARNEHTGDKIQTKEITKAYRDGWDAIFGKAEEQMKEASALMKQKVRMATECCGKCSPCSGHDNEEEESSKP